MVERFLIALVSAIVVAIPHSSSAQPDGCSGCKVHNKDTVELIKQADRLYAEFKPQEAAAELSKVLRLEPRNLEALAKLSRAHIDIGDSVPETRSNWKEQRIREYRTAERYARQAIKADPNSTWGHFYLAASLGTMAGISPVEQQIEMAEEIRAAAEKAIALDPQNGFAYHVYGVWHRRMTEIGEMSRMMAVVWYGSSLPRGNLEKSVEYLKRAVSLNPSVIVSRLELARSYAAMEEWSLARELLKSIAKMPNKFSDDPKQKRKAEELLEKIDNR
jgi:tetratricopeptide (TPR) repeat protein